jgi:hypothetical protein
MRNVTATYVLKDGVLVPKSPADTAKLKLFNKGLIEGETVEVYITQVKDNDKTLGQLAKVHAMIRELATFTGHTFEEMKEEVKSRAGLTQVSETGSTTYKSFADCNKDDMASAIEICYSIAHLVGYQLD